MVGEVALDQVIRTDELRRRPARVSDHAAEARAMVRLARVMADSPRKILQTLTDEALELCRAGSAGISIMEAEGDNQIFRWHALSGILSQHLWGTTPREFSPCGTVVDRNSILLMSHMARHFHYFADLQPEVVEVLLAPFTVQGKTVGTVWVVMHDELHQFDPEDQRLLTNLSEFAGAAYHLRSALEASQETDRRKDEFVAILAHELRNPLTAARAATLGVQDRLQSMQYPELQNLTDIGQRQLRSMSRMIDDLLDMVRIRLDKLELRKEHVLLGAVVQQAVEACRPMIEAKQHELSLVIDETPLWVDGDPMRLTQIVSNLLGNSAKYTAAGGKITLRLEQEGAHARVRVRDNGIGLSPAMLPRIFDLYAQVDLAREAAQGGLGIGLSLTQRLVELHGGAISARSDGLGAGSEFDVTLPLSSAHSADSAQVLIAAAKPKLLATRTFRILVVDDNVDAADSLGMLLGIEGHTVQTAYDGATALKAAHSFQPQVIIQDVAMPGMDGYAVARRLRELEISGITLIAMSGFNSPKDEQAAYSAGFNHHLGKPLDLEVLRGFLNSL